jgi:hypothetical protein
MFATRQSTGFTTWTNSPDVGGGGEHGGPALDTVLQDPPFFTNFELKCVIMR